MEAYRGEGEGEGGRGKGGGGGGRGSVASTPSKVNPSGVTAAVNLLQVLLPCPGSNKSPRATASTPGTHSLWATSRSNSSVMTEVKNHLFSSPDPISLSGKMLEHRMLPSTFRVTPSIELLLCGE